MFRFRCDNCGHKIKAPDEYAGRKGKCPNCKQVVSIPNLSKESPDLVSTTIGAKSQSGAQNTVRSISQEQHTYETPEKVRPRPRFLIPFLALVVLVIFISTFFWFTRGQRGRMRLVTREMPIGKRLTSTFEGEVVVSPDSKRIAYVIRSGTKQLAVVDRLEGKEYDSVGNPVFSPDGKRVAYVAKRGQKWLVVVDGVEGKEYDNVRGLVFSPDGKRVAYWPMNGQKRFVVVDGVEGKKYDGIGEPGAIFSHDGKRIAYTASTGKKWLVVVDSVEGRQYDGIASPGPIFSLSGTRVSYIAMRGGKRFSVVNGVEGKEYDSVGDPVFGPNGERMAYVASRNKSQIVVVDGIESKEYGGIYEDGPVFSPDGIHVVYAAIEATKRWKNYSFGFKSYIVVNGESIKQYTGGLSSANFIFSPNGRRMAYVERLNQKPVVVVDDIKQSEYDDIAYKDILFFSPDSRHIAYVAVRGTKQLVVVDGVECKEYDRIGGRLPKTITMAISPNNPPSRREFELERRSLWKRIIVFSPDSQRMAYVAERERKQFVVVNEVEYREYDGIRTLTLSFSPDSKLVAYVASRGQKEVLIVGGLEVNEYDSFPKGSQVFFDGPRRLHTIAKRDGQFIYVEVKILGRIVDPSS